MISKELLSEVLGIEVWNIKDASTGALYVPDNAIGFEYKDCMAGAANIYELAHKCKEWIISKRHDVLSGGIEDGKYSCYLDSQSTENEVLNAHYANTENEAIFLACEWIMEQKELE